MAILRTGMDVRHLSLDWTKVMKYGVNMVQLWCKYGVNVVYYVINGVNMV